MVLKAYVCFCVGGGGCRGVEGPVEKEGSAKEMISFSCPPKNPGDIRWQRC